MWKLSHPHVFISTYTCITFIPLRDEEKVHWIRRERKLLSLKNLKIIVTVFKNSKCRNGKWNVMKNSQIKRKSKLKTIKINLNPHVFLWRSYKSTRWGFPVQERPWGWWRIHTQCAHATGMTKLSLEMNLALKKLPKQITSFHNYPFLSSVFPIARKRRWDIFVRFCSLLPCHLEIIIL